MNLADMGLGNYDGGDEAERPRYEGDDRDMQELNWALEKKGKEILDEEVRKYASELVSIRTQLNDLVKEEKRLKGKLHEHMEQYSKITLDDWVVKCRYHKTPASFDRLSVLRFLEKEYSIELRRQVDHMFSKRKRINRLTICVSPRIKPKGAK
jgi:hypothetical protein